MQVKIIKFTQGIPLKVNSIYKVNFETEEHYIIFNQDIWYGIFKTDAEIVQDFNELDNGQIMFNI